MPAFRTRDTPSRSLEVTTDTLQPPTLAIISPTPRAFTFPINTTNETSPYSSPSSSPFEPDLRTLAITQSPATLIRTLSPISPTSSISSTSVFSSTSSFTTISTIPSSPTSPHKRRKSSICSDIERRPRKGDEDYIKRPENAFILFRRKCCEDRQLAQEEAAAASALDAPTKKQRQADLSKTISQQWKALSTEERLYWEELAKEKKKEHEQMYPNYVYRPQRTKDRKGKNVKGKRGEFELETDSESNISFMLPLSPPTATKHGRSASAPTPPPGRQMIQIPTVYMPSCPTSPSLMPMISRRSSHPDHLTDSSASQFDFLPQNNFGSSPQYTQTESYGIDVDFYRGMFNNTQPSLHPLTMPDEMSMINGAHQLVSPASSMASGSSGPPSPNSGPFTPLNCAQSAFSFQGTSCDLQNASCLPESHPDGMPSGSPLENLHLGYPPYSWESQGSWEQNGDMLLGDEFDLSAIPPIELGMSKYADDNLTPTSARPSMSYPMVYAPDSFDASSMDANQYPVDAHGPSSFEQMFDFNMLGGPNF
ncbi:hypothetical protein BJ138DRAFT_1091882 [Hygrophoropsis aurantiaca]|uniref:Uncharacterized protein n=1 Tax=Hygrophoropsis aurantiaca TaxID=72124 RepID=A0ACB8A3I4_9AGAM|nr:hypothetical protein BJ138DRAFT_1091882 [Hygrophoropsis aurantiaca]